MILPQDTGRAREAYMATPLVALLKLRCNETRETEGERDTMHLNYSSRRSCTSICSTWIVNGSSSGLVIERLTTGPVVSAPLSLRCKFLLR